MQIEFTPESLEDLERLRDFLQQAGAPYAKKVAIDIIQGLEKLRLFPRMGLAVQRASEPDLIRDLYIGQYCVRYLIGTDRLYILRVWHDKENERNIMD